MPKTRQQLFVSLQEEDFGLALQEPSFINLHTLVCYRDLNNNTYAIDIRILHNIFRKHLVHIMILLNLDFLLYNYFLSTSRPSPITLVATSAVTYL